MLLTMLLSAYACEVTVGVSGPAGPVEGASVLLSIDDDHTPVAELEGTTNADGVVVFAGVADEGHGIRATAHVQGMIPASMESVGCTGGTIGAALHLTPADAWIEGRLTDTSGNPLTGTVGIVEVGEGDSVFPGPASIRAVDGRYRIGVRSGHVYNLYGQFPGYRFGSEGMLAPVAGQRIPVDLSLAREGSIAGVVVGADGKRLVGATVRRFPDDSRASVSGVGGSFSVPTLPGADHRVSAHQGDRFGVIEVGVVDEDTNVAGRTINMRLGRTVRGRLVDAVTGQPVGDTRVVWAASGTGMLVAVPVAADGTFVATGVPYDWPRHPGMLQSDTRARSVTFFHHDPRQRSQADHAMLGPSETDITVIFRGPDAPPATPDLVIP